MRVSACVWEIPESEHTNCSRGLQPAFSLKRQCKIVRIPNAG
jgi:hypothetical protein